MKEDIRGEICKIISKMLDSPDKYGIYPTTKCYDELEVLINNIIWVIGADIMKLSGVKRIKTSYKNPK